MTDFRENIKDIIDEWGGYTTLSCGQPALNAGHVQLLCFINNTCPFHKTPHKEDSLVFNSETFRELERGLPNEIIASLTTTPGMEGLHFRPRKVFRHNYISKRKKDSADVDITELFINFDEHYEDISKNTTASVNGADKTRYKREYEWFITNSVFDNLSCDGSEVEECGIKANWSYYPKSLSVNRITQYDISLDYQYDYWQDYVNSFEYNKEKKEWLLSEGQDIRVEKFTAQMPIQTNIHDKNANGIHWKVTKRTPVFQGADFFIRFYKMADSPVRYMKNFGNVPFSNDFYRPLDHTWRKEDSIVVVDTVTGFERYANEAVRTSDGSEDVNIYDFFTQAYYIIEMAAKYFIIIPQRGFPIFVHFFNGANSEGTVAKRLGKPYQGVTGEDLINAEYFDVVVRNHLGRLVIQFEGKGFNNTPPWIIERKDWINETVEGSETTYMSEKVRDIVVPKGLLALWGGNLRCGFLFGYLQYESSFASFIYPPRDTNVSNVEEANLAAFSPITAKELPFSIDYFKSDPLWLPLNGPGDGTDTSHSLLFHAYDGPKLETGSIGDQSTVFNNKPLFTQDAQFYKNYVDGKRQDWEPGNFYYNYPIREFSTPDMKTSNIIIQKYKFLNYTRTRHQGFNTYIGLMCGDHKFDKSFSDNFWVDGKVKTSGEVNFTPYFTDISSLGDDTWVLRDCKTPILTSIRLVSDASEDPRWEDGTTISGGISGNPQQGTSPYFIDASDHVMNFSHSWSATGLTSLEHSGSIQFYLNHEMDVPINVTSQLLALQDKTFYIELWAGYRNRDTMENCDHSNYTRIPGFFRVFTGMCLGGSISREYGKNVMNCRIEDYTTILKGMKFFNSPWFDAMKDVVAIREILRMAGFRDQGTYDPGTLISGLADDAISLDSKKMHQHFDGRTFKFESFGLPSGYNRLIQPSLKFNDGDPFIDAIAKISQYSAKLFYFDEWGIAHYEDYQDLVEQDFLGQTPLDPLYFFTTNPEVNPGQVVFNKVEHSFDIQHVVSHLKTVTNTPDMHLLIRDRIKWESIENPEASGFLGYQKTFYQAESMFGSREAQLQAMNKYALFFKPIVKLKFETYGLPLRATDIVNFEGVIVRVSKVTHNMDAQKNVWWMQVECERYQAIDASDIVPVPGEEEE